MSGLSASLLSADALERIEREAAKYPSDQRQSAVMAGEGDYCVCRRRARNGTSCRL